MDVEDDGDREMKEMGRGGGDTTKGHPNPAVNPRPNLVFHPPQGP